MSTHSTAPVLPGDLVDTAWLLANHGHPDVVILDCSWHQPHMKRNAAEEFRGTHIEGARFFDFDERIAAPETDLPHMLPTAALFEREVRALGINQRSRVICYDVVGLQTAARGWWMFRSFGHRNVAVLDGGLPAWTAANGPLAQGVPDAPAGGDFTARFEPDWVRDLAAVRASLGTPGTTLVDARSAGRFKGEEPEPRAGMRGGHMPGAVSLPFTELLQNGRFHDTPTIKSTLQAHGLDPKQQLVFSCGSGVTACILALGATLAGYEKLAVYDGSWSEWGGRDDTPIIDGP